MIPATAPRAYRRTPTPMRSVLALVLAVLVLLGLASSGLALPERADARPLVPHDVQQANASGRATSSPAAEATVRRLIAAAPLAPAARPLAPTTTNRIPPHQDADLRRARLRLPIAIRGPPAGRLA